MQKNHSGNTENAAAQAPVDNQAAAGRDGKAGPLAKAGKRKTPMLVGGVVIAVLVVVLIVVAIFWIVDSTTYVSTDDAAVDGQKVNISAKMLGRIKSFEVNEGADVTEGQKLVLLEDAELRAQVALARAQLGSARVNRDATAADFKRNQSLLANGAITQQAYDRVSQTFETAAAQYDIAQAQLSSVETQLLNTRIISPVPGAVTKPAFSVGDVVQPGQVIFTVNNPKIVWVTANFEETKIGRIAAGAEVEITVDAYSGFGFKGKVTSTGAGVLPPPFQIGEFTKTTRRIPIRIEFSNLPEGIRLMPGMSVEVKVRSK
jgi:membrane fusion protein, multidrug efflux system